MEGNKDRPRRTGTFAFATQKKVRVGIFGKKK